MELRPLMLMALRAPNLMLRTSNLTGEIARLYFIDSAVSKFVFRFMSILARNYGNMSV